MRKQRLRLLAVAAVAVAPIAFNWQVSSASTTPPDATPPSESTMTDVTHDHVASRDAEFQFGPAPDAFPAGAQMAVLAGDPTATGGVFTVRLLLPDGYVIPPHWHPTDENVTVIRGELLVGLGDVFDEAALLPALETGDFITAPADANHFVMARGETEVQVHAVGPFAITYVNPDDDPRNQ